MKKKNKLVLPKGVLKIKKGYNPNSSSIGTLVYSIPLAIAGLSGILAVLSAFHKKKSKNDEKTAVQDD